MGKSRALNSKIRESQTFASLNYRQRDLWQGIIACADDQGRMPGVAAFIRSLIWPFDDVGTTEVEDDLQILEGSGFIHRYKIANNVYLQIINWWKYQKMSWAGPSNHPKPEGWTDRIRYHGKGRKIFSADWNHSGGFDDSYVHSLPSALPSALPSELPDDYLCVNDNDNVKGNDDDNDKGSDSRPDGRNRSKSFKDKIRGEVADHFSETTGLSLPKLNTAKQKKAAGSLWFTPIREICDLVEWRKDDAQVLVDAAIARMDGDKLTIASPGSILKVCQSIVGEVKRGSYKPEYSFENEMEKFRRSQDDRVTK